VIVKEIEDADLLTRLGKSEGPRSAGLHLSTIIKALMKRLQPNRFKDGPMDLTRVEIGLLFENMLERALAEKFATTRPGEVFSDEGIAMSPDGLNPTDECLEEYKATFMSCREGVVEAVVVDGETYYIPREKFAHWFYQMRGYCKWLGTRKAILRVLFICGDYNRPIQPQFKSYAIEFAEQEIEDNWDTLMVVAREEGLLV
jgi:hypothetical protein